MVEPVELRGEGIRDRPETRSEGHGEVWNPKSQASNCVLGLK
jgi:hypothetical protein